MCILKITLLTLLCAGISFAQNIGESKERANEILTKARLAIRKNQNNQDIKSLSLKTSNIVKESYKIGNEPIEAETNSKTEISIQFENSSVNYKYIGVAESKTSKADIIEVTLSASEQFRLYFDEKTNLLLMMTQISTSEQNVQKETKYYFSDYQEKEGLLIATKIKVERDDNIAEEKTINGLKVNASFKLNIFDIKK